MFTLVGIMIISRTLLKVYPTFVLKNTYYCFICQCFNDALFNKVDVIEIIIIIIIYHIHDFRNCHCLQNFEVSDFHMLLIIYYVKKNESKSLMLYTQTTKLV